MPISNKSSESRMTKTTIRMDPRNVQRQQQQTLNYNNQLQSNNSYAYPIAESPSLTRDPSPPIIRRGSPRVFRVKRASHAPQFSSSPSFTVKSPEKEVEPKRVTVKDTTSRGTTPPPASLFDAYPTSHDIIRQQIPSTVRYQTPPSSMHPPQTNVSSTTKTSTRILDAKTLPTLVDSYDDDDDDSVIEETKTTTTIIRPMEIPTVPAVVTSSVTAVPQVTTVVPAVETTTIHERPTYRTRRYQRRRTRSPSTLSNYTTSSTDSYTTNSTITPRPHVIKQHTILPPRPPIQTTIINDPPTTIVPERRFIHHVRRTRTHSGYYSSDLDFGKRKVYKSDYKYRHYYYCNWCKGRCDLPNKSCGCCEWFYGCPVWALILLGLLLLALIVTFFTLFGLQPTINSARRSETAQTQVLNRTQIIYGYLQNCGTQANSPTTLVLCANTATTSTSVVQLSSYYIVSEGIKTSVYNQFFIVVFFLTFSYI
ncbi:unnamed protein product [Rotaria socialis]|uniref:Uncharacterized protein n=1 Tax=Rotaria socialis TaxID=392032 RepID=A0A818PLA2_9BILA|nr:unnamed protein product [Rotaria socialis]CAF4636691.1 unnamed protein product [Rotaria socialis]